MMRLTTWVVIASCLPGAWAYGQKFQFDTPSDDRWHYPFNFTPGIRASASCFGAAGIGGFNDRDGCVIVAWDTSAAIPPGQGAGAYKVKSVRVTLTNVKDAQWPVDLTPDEWFTFDINGDGTVNLDGIPRGESGDLDGESDEEDPGRPLELFGVGFGPVHDPATWTETSIFVGSSSTTDEPRDPFPFVYQELTLNVLHVEDNVKGLHNASVAPPVFEFTPVPWAIGVPQSYTPGAQPVPFDVEFELNLELSDGAVRQYFQDQLDAGRVIVHVSSLLEAVQQGSQSDFPAFFMKEGLFLDPGAKAPKLEICLGVGADLDCDGDVDGGDFLTFSNCFNAALNPPTAQCENPDADLDNDGDVDGTDFLTFSNCFNGALNPPASLCAG